jgi:hypothetical protein
MSNRICSFHVILYDDRGEEAAERIASAIRMISGVSSVTPMITTDEGGLAMEVARRRLEIKYVNKLHAAVEEIFK